MIEGQARFMAELFKAASEASAKGRRLAEIVQFQDGKPVATSLRLPDTVKQWIGPSLPMQVRDAYEEVTRATPHGSIPGAW